MKLFIVLAAVALAQADKLDRVYLPANAQTSAGSGQFLQTPYQSFTGHNANTYSGAPASDAFAQNAYSGAPASNAYAQSDYSSAPASNDYAQSAYSGAPGSNGYAQNAYSGFARPERPQAAFERNAAILRQDYTNDGQSYSYAYETENGISADENGVATHGTQAQGGYSYTGDDGKVYSVRYTADENGFVPQGDHLPTPPPIPEAILKSLEVIARAQAAGSYDSGAYNSGDSQQQYYNSNAQPSYDSNPAALDKAYLPPY